MPKSGKRWGKFKSGGRLRTVSCNFCGRSVAKSKAVSVERGFSIGKIPGIDRSQVYAPRRKVYACISCAKHRHLL